MTLTNKINNIINLENTLMDNMNIYSENIDPHDSKTNSIELQNINITNKELKEKIFELNNSKHMNDLDKLNQVQLDKFRSVYNNYSNTSKELNELNIDLNTLNEKKKLSNLNVVSVKSQYNFILLLTLFLILITLKFLALPNLKLKNIFYLIMIISFLLYIVK